jgi:hypothetical protein
LIAGLAVAAGIAAGVSALVDRPARTLVAETEIDASRTDVWGVLTDFPAYREWNPLITEATGGNATPGDRLSLQIEPLGQDPDQAEVEVLIVREGRKLRWRDRLLLPGIRDREYEVVLDDLGGDRTKATLRQVHEGLLVPFTEVEGMRRGLELMAKALKARAESSTD